MTRAAINPAEDIERSRRLSGLNLSELSRRADVPYPRIWNYFRGRGFLTDDELTRVRAVIEEAS